MQNFSIDSFLDPTSKQPYPFITMEIITALYKKHAGFFNASKNIFKPGVGVTVVLETLIKRANSNSGGASELTLQSLLASLKATAVGTTPPPPYQSSPYPNTPPPPYQSSPEPAGKEVLEVNSITAHRPHSVRFIPGISPTYKITCKVVGIEEDIKIEVKSDITVLGLRQAVVAKVAKLAKEETNSAFKQAKNLTEKRLMDAKMLVDSKIKHEGGESLEKYIQEGGGDLTCYLLPRLSGD